MDSVLFYEIIMFFFGGQLTDQIVQDTVLGNWYITGQKRKLPGFLELTYVVMSPIVF